MGAVSSLNSFSGAIAPVISTPLLVYTASSDPNSLSAGVPYLLSGSVLCLGLLIAISFAIRLTRIKRG